jgi:hypothetical protein
LTIRLGSKDPYLTTFLRPTKTGERRGGAMASGKCGRVKPYGALFLDVILPTQSRWHKRFVLLTCGGGIGSQRADSVGVARVVFNGSKVLSRWLSGPKGILHSFLELASSSSSDQLLQLVKNSHILVATRVRRV